MNEKDKRKVIILCIILFILSVIVSIISLSIGRYSKVSFGDAVRILTDSIFNSKNIDKTSVSYNVVVNLRFPRIVGSLFVGAALACAGTAFQALFANPIASPDTLGVTHGASFGAVIGILIGKSLFLTKSFAFVLGCIVVVSVYVAANKLNHGRNLTQNLLLIGMIVSSIFQALVSMAKYMADPDNQLPQITYWLMGSFSQFGMKDVLPLIIFFVIGFIPLFAIRWRLNILTLNDIEARALGVNIKLLRIITILCATLLTAISTSLTGGITWFGLIIPHIARLIVGNDFRKILPLSVFLGSSFLVIMDTIARSISMQEIPISILTSLFGAPLFIFILIRNRRSHS